MERAVFLLDKRTERFIIALRIKNIRLAVDLVVNLPADDARAVRKMLRKPFRDQGSLS